MNITSIDNNANSPHIHICILKQLTKRIAIYKLQAFSFHSSQTSRSSMWHMYVYEIVASGFFERQTILANICLGFHATSLFRCQKWLWFHSSYTQFPHLIFSFFSFTNCTNIWRKNNLIYIQYKHVSITKCRKKNNCLIRYLCVSSHTLCMHRFVQDCMLLYQFLMIIFRCLWRIHWKSRINLQHNGLLWIDSW